MPRQVEELERRGWKALSGPEGSNFYDDPMAAMSSVYAWIDGRWRLLLHQQSPESRD